jgi:hypothetical protein
MTNEEANKVTSAHKDKSPEVKESSMESSPKDTSKGNMKSVSTEERKDVEETDSARDSNIDKQNNDEVVMIRKVNQQMAEDDDSFLAKIIGLGLIILGIVFIILAILVVFLSRRDPSVDNSLEVPTINSKSHTNEQNILVFGKAQDNSDVMFFINDETYKDGFAEVEDGKYEYLLPVTEEGEYEIEAAIVVGFPVQRRSEKSDKIIVNVDWTRPSGDVELKYDEISTDGKFTLEGKTEPNATVILRDSKTGDEFEAKADEDGNFKFDSIELDKENTEFEVIIVDQAGNERVLDEKITIKYDKNIDNGGDGNNGDDNNNGGTTNPDLPESAGELEAAMDFILGNQIMVFMGLFALIVFGFNSGLVLKKIRR